MMKKSQRVNKLTNSLIWQIYTFTSDILITVQFIRKLTEVMKYQSVYDLIIKSVHKCNNLV